MLRLLVYGGSLSGVVAIIAIVAVASRTNVRVERRMNSGAQLGRAASFNCGVVGRDEPKEFSIALSNYLKRPLLIKGVNVSCGCVSIVDLPTSIDAESIAKLRFRVDASRSVGQLRQQIIVLTDSDDPARSVYQVRVLASVRGAWAEPRRLALGRVNTTTDTVAEFTISALGYRRASVASIRCDNPHMRCKLRPSDILDSSVVDVAAAPKHTFKVAVSIDDCAPIGRLTAHVIVLLETDREVAEAQALIEAEVIGRVECVPASLLWASAVPGEKLAAEAVLRLPRGRTIDLASLQFASSGHAVVNLLESSAEKARIGVEFLCPAAADYSIIRERVFGVMDGEQLFELGLIAVVKLPNPGGGVER